MPKETRKAFKFRSRLPLTIIATFIGCFFLFEGLHHLEEISSPINPIRIFFKGFDFSDAYYHINKHLDETQSNDIIVINTGKSTRGELARLIAYLNQPKNRPKVIGLDYYLSESVNQTDSVGTAALDAIISKSDNIVLGYDPENRLVKGKPPVFQNQAGSLSLSDDEGTIRKAAMITNQRDSIDYSFGLLIAKAYYSADRPIIHQIYHDQSADVRIDYLKPEAFTTKDATWILQHQNDIDLKDKCVLIGNAEAPEDLHYTPLNDQMTGRNSPDMQGLFVHANIIYTLGAPDPAFIFTELPVWLTLMCASLIGIFFLYFLIIVYQKMHTFFHFGCVLIYEPIMYFAQLYLSVLLYSWHIHLDFAIPFLLLSIAPFSIYIVHFLQVVANKILHFIFKGKFTIVSYYSENHHS